MKHKLAADKAMCSSSWLWYRMNSLPMGNCMVVLLILRKHLKFVLLFFIIDFKKAFDLIDRNTLWLILKKNVLEAKCVRQSKVCMTMRLLWPEFE